jgi:phage/plasmid-associated DNA primase
VILAVNNNPMRFTDRSGGVSRRRVIIHFPEQIAPEERDPQLKDKIARELAVIVRQLMQQFSDPMSARALLQSQQNSDEALSIKRDADPAFDFCGYLEALPRPTGCLWGMPTLSRASRACISITPIWCTWRPRLQERAQPDHVRQRALSHAERVRTEL